MELQVFHTCKSRFCPSCGIAQTKQWVEKFEFLFCNTSYKHIVFHPPEEFRDYFGIGKTPYFNMLFAIVHQTLRGWYEKKGYLPGIMAVIHTFGRDEKFTPHIHCLMTCGGLDTTQTKWITISDGYIDYDFLRFHFKANFLKGIRELWQEQLLEKIPMKLRFLFTPLYQNKIVQIVLEKTWYVWVSKKLANAYYAVKYIARYTKRPPIAESRITDYDGALVTFTFIDHKTDKPTVITLPVEDFIGKIIRHIPDENFRVIRYYGLFANRVRGELLPKVFTLLGQNYAKAIERFLATSSSFWRRQLELFTRLDPLICPVCFVPFELISIMYTTHYNGPNPSDSGIR